MRLFLPLKRATLLIPSGSASDQERKHLFVLLTDPQGDDEKSRQVLMVSASTVKPGVRYDPTCLLYQGDHPFIRHKSYIAYQRARIELVMKVVNGVKAGVLIQHETMDSAIFARICKGLEESRLTTPDILDFYRKSIY